MRGMPTPSDPTPNDPTPNDPTPTDPTPAATGPLAGVRILELAGLGALPFATLKLADMGADVIRVHRVAEVPADRPAPEDVPVAQRWREFDRGRRSIAVDLKSAEGWRSSSTSPSAVTRCSRRSARGSPSGSASGRSRCWRATRGWSTAG